MFLNDDTSGGGGGAGISEPVAALQMTLEGVEGLVVTGDYGSTSGAQSLTHRIT